ncbi:MAG: GNAT family N-acetyltransferase [Rhodococcus sp. (in: high G+C Gram-positive bacteria)]|uniref:GNAT family N-acetyltransferase n=1 Tax=Rhodococcus TaxID=1827 RepID=UPI000D04A280|nr:MULTISPECIES: GNAT family N-acetyltransferase [Rhodococcus]AYA25991.1 GNAT family N-acetyltransferase [Rhodococcus rhodochrous]MXQ77562.1 GNAT family N-acetyltransferase [Rhodococcus rhodochrous]
MAIEPRTATRRDIPAFAPVVAEAFVDDPVFTWMFPDEHHRIRRMTRFFAADARHHMVPLGATDIAESDGVVGGAAMWAPPGRWRSDMWTSLRLLPGFCAALGRYMKRGRQVDETLDAAHPGEPHWYLSTIGTSPAARGTGLGTALMKAGLDRADAEHAPAYLESSKEANVPYYERFGFEVTRAIVVPDGGPTLWGMWRQPR